MTENLSDIVANGMRTLDNIQRVFSRDEIVDAILHGVMPEGNPSDRLYQTNFPTFGKQCLSLSKFLPVCWKELHSGDESRVSECEYILSELRRLVSALSVTDKNLSEDGKFSMSDDVCKVRENIVSSSPIFTSDWFDRVSGNSCDVDGAESFMSPFSERCTNLGILLEDSMGRSFTEYSRFNSACEYSGIGNLSDCIEKHDMPTGAIVGGEAVVSGDAIDVLSRVVFSSPDTIGLSMVECDGVAFTVIPRGSNRLSFGCATLTYEEALSFASSHSCVAIAFSGIDPFDSAWELSCVLDAYGYVSDDVDYFLVVSHIGVDASFDRMGRFFAESGIPVLISVADGCDGSGIYECDSLLDSSVVYYDQSYKEYGFGRLVTWHVGSYDCDDVLSRYQLYANADELTELLNTITTRKVEGTNYVSSMSPIALSEYAYELQGKLQDILHVDREYIPRWFFCKTSMETLYTHRHDGAVKLTRLSSDYHDSYHLIFGRYYGSMSKMYCGELELSFEEVSDIVDDFLDMCERDCVSILFDSVRDGIPIADVLA